MYLMYIFPVYCFFNDFAALLVLGLACAKEPLLLKIPSFSISCLSNQTPVGETMLYCLIPFKGYLIKRGADATLMHLNM